MAATHAVGVSHDHLSGGTVKLNSLSFMDGEAMPDRYALRRNAGPTTLVPAENLNPHLAWNEVPDGTASFVLLCADLDAPTDKAGINKPGVTFDDDSERALFYHWVVADLPANVRDIDEGAYAPLPGEGASTSMPAPAGRPGHNDYTGMPGVEDGAGLCYGGPAPPWNDSRPHRYRFTLYALSVPSLDLPDGFKAADVLTAMKDAVLAESSLTAVYTLNTSLSATQVGSPSVS
ncbi:hypothetical protein CAL12_24395 [Bordetella genomosp. 8]|uniref:Phosphatidylethanolamine-binding protein n=2 Tax=Bordetella genomosp. 8 TaxID=1416806 RepID=A0A1W6YRU4_9BORD|nr:hypothetical protein CAL12_24395 [Bordetella genomosp. 8]